MLQRKFSLKGKYNFKAVLQNGETFYTPNLMVKSYRHSEGGKQFGIIVSSKFNKKAVIKSKAKRIISEAIRENLNYFPDGRYVFIPKKNLLGFSGKISLNAKDISSEINTLLPKMAVA